MFNVGGTEMLVILFVALIVLGPERLPEYARKFGNIMGELRRMSTGFQSELRNAMDDVTRIDTPPTADTSAPAPAYSLEKRDKPNGPGPGAVTPTGVDQGSRPSGQPPQLEPDDPAA